MKYWFLTGLVLVPATVAADEVTLQSGARLQGILRKGDGKRIELEMGVGTAWFDRKEVLSTSPGRTPLHEYYERWEGVKESAKAEDFLALARFARENRLSKFLRPLLEKVVTLDPQNEEARRALGFEKLEGRWMTRAEANRAKGLLEFEGRWMTAAEKELILNQRLESRLRAQQEMEERRRKREAEELERARRAVVVQTPQPVSEGFWYRPSEFWPYYYRGPRRVPYWGVLDAVPTFDIFDIVPNPLKTNVKK